MAWDPVFVRYVDQLTHVEYYKYDVVVNYFDLRFKYKNLGGNADGTFTLKIEGIVDLVEPRDYLIFSKTKPTSEATNWVVRVPEISNNQIPAWNYGASTYNVSKIPTRQFIDRGLNYDVNVTGKYNTEGPVSKYLGIYPHVRIDLIPANYPNIVLYSDPDLGETGPFFIVTNTALVMSDYVRGNFYRFNREYPHVVVNYDPPPANAASNQNNQDPEYFQIPIGVKRYRVTLTNNQTQEKVVSFIEGTLWNNPVYSPVQQIASSLPPPQGAPALLTLNLAQPPSSGNPNSTSDSNNQVITGIDSNGNIITGYPAPYDQGQSPWSVEDLTSTVAGVQVGMLAIPDVRGLSTTVARRTIVDAGFTYAGQIGNNAPTAADVGKVYTQSPPGGYRSPGETITVTYYGSYTGGTSGTGTGGTGTGGTGGGPGGGPGRPGGGQ